MTVIHEMRSLFRWSDLILVLALKDIKRRYKQKYLRSAWAVINPVFTLVVFTLIFSKVAKVSSEGVPYPLFGFTALIPWYLFSSSLMSSANSLVTNSHLITRLKFPRIILPIASIGPNLLDFFISLPLLALLFVIYGAGFGINVWFLIPILMIQLILMFGLGFILAVGNAYLRDIQAALTIFIQGWLLISPVAYSMELVGRQHRLIYLMNPMAGILDSYRKVLLHNEMPNFFYLSVSLVMAIILFQIGYRLFRKLERNLADII